MKPSTRSILEGLGWQDVVEKYPVTAMQFARVLRPEPGGLDAKENIKTICKVEEAIDNLCDALRNLSSCQIRDIDCWINDEEQTGYYPHPYVWDLYISSKQLKAPLKDRREFLAGIVRNSGPGSISPLTGKKRKARAPLADDTLYKIAFALAEVYLLGLRRCPLTAGSDAITGMPNSAFHRSLIEILRSEGRSVPSPNTIINLANAAKRKLTLGRVKQILAENAQTLHRWQFTSVYAIASRSVLWCEMQGDEFELWQQVTGDH